MLVRVRPQGLLPEGFLFDRGERPTQIRAPQPNRVGDAIAVKPHAGQDDALRACRRAPPAQSPVILEVRDLSKRFGGIAACRGLNLDLQRGKIAALGRSQRRRQDDGVQSSDRRLARRRRHDSAARARTSAGFLRT